ncbi:hypothetical protein CCYS_08335 [Corynebacterium cystitidis DSM 20524]|uniref:Uncharacterized protein n=1 Tax=Corynebacterium cystitidis DSM 20524 TaxID=1121357 RepID=A0A1H9PAD1_9CORY|nr:hypothetical protein CCYS_08335 [Corynebacterium cystitidis DSM 20524]SER44563.1 hypothetical protein SAMN05661109_00251 [Corynebacterium cystitidis DSM 20524]SNV73142.1 Uncharacterised protein [Corynebacterium cystitidis]
MGPEMRMTTWYRTLAPRGRKAQLINRGYLIGLLGVLAKLVSPVAHPKLGHDLTFDLAHAFA